METAFSYLEDTWEFFGRTFERQGALRPWLLHRNHLELGTTIIWTLTKILT